MDNHSGDESSYIISDSEEDTNEPRSKLIKYSHSQHSGSVEHKRKKVNTTHHENKSKTYESGKRSEDRRKRPEVRTNEKRKGHHYSEYGDYQSEKAHYKHTKDRSNPKDEHERKLKDEKLEGRKRYEVQRKRDVTPQQDKAAPLLVCKKLAAAVENEILKDVISSVVQRVRAASDVNGDSDSAILVCGDSSTRSSEVDVVKLSATQSESIRDETFPSVTIDDDDYVHSKIEFKKRMLPSYFPAIHGCRSVSEFQCLNRIEEGTYGVVFRALEKRTQKIVALKQVKLNKERDGFPITSLREVNTLLKGQHPNIVTVKEIVVDWALEKVFIVMDYVEHDLNSLIEVMNAKNTKFLSSEVKCLMVQLLHAVNHLHDNWILHRDLKTSNLLFSHGGILKIGDFGLAREYGSPLKHYTPIVVSLWYRAPELLLGTKEYSTSIDMWSVGCIFAEFLQMQPLFRGETEIDQLKRIFKGLGTPNDKNWPDFTKLPLIKKVNLPHFPANRIRSMFVPAHLSTTGYDLLSELLKYDPKKRITAEDALRHDYFNEYPLPVEPGMFAKWPAKSELDYQNTVRSPKPPLGRQCYKELKEDGFYIGVGERNNASDFPLQSTFTLKF